MTTLERILEEAQSLSREEQAAIVDTLLEALHRPDGDAEAKCVLLAKGRAE